MNAPSSWTMLGIFMALSCHYADPLETSSESRRVAASSAIGLLPGSGNAGGDSRDAGFAPGGSTQEDWAAGDASPRAVNDATPDIGSDAVASGSSALMSGYAVLVSIDGLAPRFIEQLASADELPALSRIMRRAAWTHEARTSPGSSVTLPNHFSMLTSRPVLNDVQSSPGGGHQFTTNTTPADGRTIHSSSDEGYVPSIFDLVHDRGGRTALLAGKSKFVAFADGYGPEHGAPDLYADDNGQNKIDFALVEGTELASEIVASFIEKASENPFNFTFLHMRDPDGMGHKYGWGSPEYLDALKAVDRALGELMLFLDTTEPYSGRVHVVITADHGGDGFNHGQSENATNFTIPLYVVSPTVDAEQDLYALAGALRSKPPVGVYASPAGESPLHNADAGNLCATLLGLPEVPYSTLHSFHLQGKWPYQDEIAASRP